MDSYIDKYNKEVEEKCKEIMMNKKNIIRRDILAPNKSFNSNMGGFVSQPNLTKKQFINTIKNGYVNLGEKTPSVSQLEDLYIKSFKNFSFEEFAEFMDLVQFGNFQTIEDAYKSFIIDLKDRNTALPEPSSPPPSPESSVDINENITFQQFYPPVGQEGHYGYVPSSRNSEMGISARREAENERRRSEASTTNIRPVKFIFNALKGRPATSGMVFDDPALGSFSSSGMPIQPTPPSV